MYDDLLGPRKKITQVTKLSGGRTRSQKIVFRCDYRTINGRLYPRATMEVALTKALGKVSGFFIVSGGTPKDPFTVNLQDAIGTVKAFLINAKGEVWFEIKYLDESLAIAYEDVDISACSIGKIDRNKIVHRELIVTQLYVIE